MKTQRTLTDLQHLAGEVFAEAKATIEISKLLVRECVQRNLDLKHSAAQFPPSKIRFGAKRL